MFQVNICQFIHNSHKQVHARAKDRVKVKKEQILRAWEINNRMYQGGIVVECETQQSLFSEKRIEESVCETWENFIQH